MATHHAFYVYASWGIAAATLVAVVARTWFESVRLKRDLARLGAQGIRRRSVRPEGGEAV